MKKIESGEELLKQAEDLTDFIYKWKKHLKEDYIPHLKVYEDFIDISKSLTLKIIRVLENELQNILRKIKSDYN